MSTERQLNGDSLRRQTQRTREWAEANGVILDTEFDLHDIGRSAFDGSHVQKGQLGRFLAAIRDGHIAAGSYLIVESLDRLSREKPTTALSQFLEVLNHGINIVTLFDGKVYRPDSTETFDLMQSVIIMSRANEESQTKSKRISEAWGRKRRDASKKILTQRCVQWVKARADGTGFDEIPERVATVRRIFDEYVNGEMGADLIARRLNKEKIPTFGRSRGWQKSYVQKILRNQAVIGEFQPHEKRAGERRPVGEPLAIYYPPVIDELTFLKAQAARTARRVGRSGRKGPGISNLFSGLVRCGCCGGPMHFHNHGNGSSGKVLRCDSATRNLGCSAHGGWKYDHLERTFLTFVREADPLLLLRGLTPNPKVSETRQSFEIAEARLLKAKAARDRVFGLILGNEPTDYLSGKLRQIDAEVASLEAAMTAEKLQMQTAEADEIRLQDTSGSIANLIGRLQSETSDEVFKIRSAISGKMKDLIAEIWLWPTEEGMGQQLNDLLGACGDRARQYFYAVMVAGPQRRVRITFKDGSFHFLTVTADDLSVRLSARSGEPYEVMPGVGSLRSPSDSTLNKAISFYAG